jgi:hypothetical protein
MATTFDLALFQPATPFAAASLAITAGGRQVSGLEKLAQRFIVELMTPKGSMPFRSSRGTDFAAMVGNGSALSEFDIFSSFSHALLDAGAALQGEEDPVNDPPNERFSGAQLVSLSLNADALVLQVAVASLDGGVGTFSVPVQLGAE